MAIETRELIDSIKQTAPAPSFLRDRYFGNVVELSTLKVEFDKLIKGARIAPIVARQIGGKTVSRGSFSNYSYETPLVAPETPINEEDLHQRQFGHTEYDSAGPDDVEAEIAGEILADHEDDITRLEEKLCADAITKGQLVLVGEGYSETIQYWPQTNAPYKALAAGARWNESTAKIVSDCRAASAEVRKSGAIAADMVLGADAAAAFLDSEAVQKLLDNKGISAGGLDLTNPPAGVEYLGRFLNFDVFVYADQYDDDQGVKQYYLDPKAVLFAPRKPRTALPYGVLRVKDGAEVINVKGRRAPYAYVGAGRDVSRYVGMKSAPLPVVGVAGEFYVLKVLA